MIQVSVSEMSDSLTGLMGAFRAVSGSKLPENTQIALKASVELMAEEWRAYLTKSKEFPGSDKLKRPMNRLANRVESAITNNGLGGKVTINAPWSEWMEKGAKAFDMKTTHPYGKKSRVGKDGTPYLVIPIRHGSPGSERNPMPSTIYNAVRAAVRSGKFKPSKVLTTQDHVEPNFKGQPVWRAGYQWGSRVQGLSPEFQNLEGLVYFSKKSSSGGYLNSSYMTFRIISAKSPDGAWVMPERPKVIPHVIEATRDDIAELMEAGLRQDLGL